MKKILLLTVLLIGLTSCTNDDCPPVEECGCNAWVRQEGEIRTVIPLELDCETGEQLNLPKGYTFLGCDNDDTP